MNETPPQAPASRLAVLDTVRGRPLGSAPIAPAKVPGLQGLLGLAVGVVMIAGLYFAKDVLVPITLAVLLSFVLSPIVLALRRLRLPKGLAVLVAVLAALGAVAALGTLVGTQAASLSADAPRYAQTIEAKIERVKAFAAARTAFLTQELGSTRRSATTVSSDGNATAATSAERTATEESRGGRQPLSVRVVEDEDSPLTIASNILYPVLAPFETFVIVLVVAIFILMQKEDLRDRMIRVFGSSDLHRTTTAIDDAGTRLSRYFLSQIAVNATFGLVVGIGLWLIGLPVPALWGVLAGILRFVPYIGALLGAALPLGLAAAVDPGWSMVIYVALLFAICEPIVGYVVEPLLYGHSTGLSPLSVVLAAVFWTWIWGPVGLVLSMPLTLLLVVLGRHVPSLEFVDVLLGDRPALTPVESFYQRMLANDPEEALEQAEQLLKEHSLTAYYDEVVVGGLKLAAEDARRGAIDKARVQAMVAAMLSLIDELFDHDEIALRQHPHGARSLAPVDENPGEAIDDTPPPVLADAPGDWEAPGAIVCIAGRGVFDDAVSAMLDQLLANRGFGVRRVPHSAAARNAVETLDLSSARMVCLSYLEIGGTPAHLRYLVRRLRRRSGAPVLVGLWPEGEAALSDEAIQSELGADVYVGTLGKAVEACLDQARGAPGSAAG